MLILFKKNTLILNIYLKYGGTEGKLGISHPVQNRNENLTGSDPPYDDPRVPLREQQTH